jgi:hypothetical protein
MLFVKQRLLQPRSKIFPVSYLMDFQSACSYVKGADAQSLIDRSSNGITAVHGRPLCSAMLLIF